MNKAEKFISKEKADWEKWHEEYPLIYGDNVRFYILGKLWNKFELKSISPEYNNALDKFCPDTYR